MGEGHLSGLFLRRLHDIDGGPLNSWDDRAFYTGLLRLDYSPKPAAQELLAYGAPPLPNVTTTSLPLRVVAYKPPYVFDPDSENDGAPKPIEGTPFYVKRDIRRVWDTFGGQYSFGLPLMNAYKRAEDNRVVQYFEAGVIVLYPDARDDEDYQELGHLEKLMARARLMDVGSQYTEGRVFAPPEREYRGERYFPETGHYLRGEFRRVYQNSLGEWRLGLPLSEQILEEVNGEQLVVQYFENGRLELDPVQNRGRFGQLGSWRFAVQCENMP
jgi:hypothetical protein